MSRCTRPRLLAGTALFALDSAHQGPVIDVHGSGQQSAHHRCVLVIRRWDNWWSDDQRIKPGTRRSFRPIDHLLCASANICRLVGAGMEIPIYRAQSPSGLTGLLGGSTGVYDNLDGSIKNRLEWRRKCALIANCRDPVFLQKPIFINIL